MCAHKLSLTKDRLVDRYFPDDNMSATIASSSATAAAAADCFFVLLLALGAGAGAEAGSCPRRRFRVALPVVTEAVDAAAAAAAVVSVDSLESSPGSSGLSRRHRTTAGDTLLSFP